MEINTDRRAGQTLLPGQSEQRQTEARQGRWLYELEQALLLRSDKKPVAPESAPEDLPEQAAAPEPQAAASQGAGAGAGAARRAAPASAGGRDGAPREAAAAAAGGGADGGQAAPAAWATPSAAPLAAGAGGGMAPTGIAVAVTAQQAGTAPPLIPLAAYASAGPQAASEAGAGSVRPLHDGAPAVMAGVRWLSAPAEDEAAPAPEPAAPEEETPAAAARDQQPADDYSSRLMHVYQGAEGVQAWVRDAGIGAAQSMLLARGMADELRGEGSRLAALTVNGKKILSDSDNQSINSTGAV